MYKVVVLGAGDLGFGVLQGLLESQHDVVGVLPWESITDRGILKSVKRKFIEDNTSLIERHGLHKLKPCKANSEDFAQQVEALDPDVLLVACWGEILSENTIKLPGLASINVHPSLLPRHRGFNPISSVLRSGEKDTGVTFHHLSPKIDAGDILLQSSIKICPADDGDSLSRKLSFRAKETVATALDLLQESDKNRIPQDESQACYRPRLTANDCKIDWRATAQSIHDQVRSGVPHLTSFTLHRGKALHILNTKIVDLFHASTTPGQILYKLGTQIIVASGDPKQGILITKFRLAEKMGSTKGKLYAANSIAVGDILE